jgi:nickel-dependent lactate racemase
MAIYAEKGGPDIILKRADKEQLVAKAVARIGKVRKALILPPDFTRYHSNAGELTAIFYSLLTKQGTAVDILPALGTHFKMTEAEIRKMFGPDIPLDRFKAHDWRGGITKIGEVPSAFINKVSEGKLDYAVNVEVDNLLLDPSYEVIISIGQVVPHEVAGMANHNKNIFVGAGGSDIINKTHFLGAVYNMERIMGRAASPVRDVLNYAEDNFLAGKRIVYAQTVMSRQGDGSMAMNGLYIGDGREGYVRAAALSQRVNIILLDAPIKKAVVYLDPSEFK